MRPPERAYTGRGYHLLFAIPKIMVADCPDLKERIKMFQQGFANAYRRELEHLDAALDSTPDLRRVVRVYGTSKPSVGINSEFYGINRDEDMALQEYLLSISISPVATADTALLTPGTSLPAWFEELLLRDQQLRNLCNGNGKATTTDTSRSGFDYSIIKRLAWLAALKSEGRWNHGPRND